jgi:hypothetical protein
VEKQQLFSYSFKVEQNDFDYDLIRSFANSVPCNHREPKLWIEKHFSLDFTVVYILTLVEIAQIALKLGTNDDFDINNS